MARFARVIFYLILNKIQPAKKFNLITSSVTSTIGRVLLLYRAFILFHELFLFQQ